MTSVQPSATPPAPLNGSARTYDGVPQRPQGGGGSVTKYRCPYPLGGGAMRYDVNLTFPLRLHCNRRKIFVRRLRPYGARAPPPPPPPLCASPKADWLVSGLTDQRDPLYRGTRCKEFGTKMTGG